MQNSAPISTTRYPHFSIASEQSLNTNTRQKKQKYKIYHPRSEFKTKWNNIFLLVCLISLFLDPLFFYVPTICGPACVDTDDYLLYIIMWFRTVVDCFYATNIYFKFKTSFVNPDTQLSSRGEVVKDPKAIALRYLKKDFMIDFLAMLPVPQMILWFVYPKHTGDINTYGHNYIVAFFVLVQYIPRLCVMLPLNKKIADTTGTVAKNAFSGAIYNLVLFTLAGHVIGSIWYLWALEKVTDCWGIQCMDVEANDPDHPCNISYFSPYTLDTPDRTAWFERTKLVKNCDPNNEDATYKFGIFDEALKSEIYDVDFWGTYLYCLWWGLRNLGSYGQGLNTTLATSQNLFSIFVGTIGLCFNALLIGELQNFLQSMMVRIEEWRVQRRDTEEWMQHRQLPEELRERVRRFDQYKWLATRGVDEGEVLQELPLDLRREIQKHLCLKLVRRVPFFAQMDDQLLDAICERLEPSLSTKDTNIFREGDPVTDMLFIIRGKLESSTTYGGRTGFYNSIILRQGDFCGEELLTWAVLPASTDNLPSSTRTVKAITDVEAFSLEADDLKYVGTQFKRLQSKKIQHAFRYYSHQWRTWGACFIQAAWRRYKKRKMAEELAGLGYYYSNTIDNDDTESNYRDEPLLSGQEVDHQDPSSSSLHSSSHNLATTLLTSKFAANARKGAAQKDKILDTDNDLKMPRMFKPEDPDFS